MNVIVHLPTKDEHIKELKKRVSVIHSEKVINYISNSGLSIQDKEIVIERIALALE